MNASTNHHFTNSVILVGGGLMGASLTVMLAQLGYHVTLIDKNAKPSPPDLNEFSLRINAYNRIAQQILEAIGIWKTLPQERIFPFYRVMVGHETGPTRVQFNASDIHEPHLGHFIENHIVLHHLMHRIEQIQTATCYFNTTVTAIKTHHDRITVITEPHKNHLHGSLLIACDGAYSQIRDLCHIRTHRQDYQQQCLVGTIIHQGDHQHTAWQRFLKTGPLGLLPLAPGYCSLAWSCDTPYAEQLLQQTEQAFITSLDHAIEHHLGPITAVKHRRAFPLFAQHAATYTAPRTILVGDAAHVIHPLAGLGANLGFQDIATLTSILKQAQQQGLEPGSNYVRLRYTKARRSHNALTMSTMTGLKCAFSSSHPTWLQWREPTLKTINRLPLLKRFLTQQAVWMSLS